MRLSWNEIRNNAIAFGRKWADAARERAEAQTFWNEFMQVFGVERRAVASFEEPVKRLGDRRGSIDLFWRGVLLVEHKSRGQSLDRAESQAFDYVQSLVTGGRRDEVPRYVVVSDFATLVLYDLEADADAPETTLSLSL